MMLLACKCRRADASSSHSCHLPVWKATLQAAASLHNGVGVCKPASLIGDCRTEATTSTPCMLSSLQGAI